jgi:diguanylate cyclase (GGDEF)-like protein
VLAFVDVDGLKAVNDGRGHAAGDRLLQRVADSVRAKLRSYDLIVRYGGDEFVCTISGQTLADVTRRFALVNTVLADRLDSGSVTVGFAELLHSDSAPDFVARADAAMYLQRAAGTR